MLQILLLLVCCLPLIHSQYPSPRSLPACPALCSSCQSSSQCSSCYLNAHLDTKSMCVCDDGFYLSTSGTCLQCNQEACRTCATSGSCTECVSHATKTSLGCQCEPGYFWAASLKCDICHETCRTCKGSQANKCLNCPVNGTWLPDYTCICNNKYFWSSFTKTCALCDSSCLTCIDPTSQGCFSCSTNMVLEYNSAPGVCKCKEGLFWNRRLKDCTKCDLTCATCTSDGLCETCISNAELDASKVCNCSIGFYLLEGKCQTCDSSCVTCSNGSLSGCLTCSNFAVLKGPPPNNCVCPVGSYMPTYALNCLLCHENCKTCFDSSSDACLSCKEQASLDSSPPSSCSAILDTSYRKRLAENAQSHVTGVQDLIVCYAQLFQISSFQPVEIMRVCRRRDVDA